MVTSIAIALTGHRPTKLGGYDITTPPYLQLQKDLEQYIAFQLSQYNEVWCHSGLALGADTIWSKAILKMKEQYPNRVFFHAEVPTTSQSSPWFNADDINFWQYQVDNADRITIYDAQFHKKPKEEKDRLVSKVLNDRNMGMVDACDVLLGLYDGQSKGGTRNALDYAQSQGVDVVLLDINKYFSN